MLLLQELTIMEGLLVAMRPLAFPQSVVSLAAAPK
jgi:hypothetical protein